MPWQAPSPVPDRAPIPLAPQEPPSPGFTLTAVWPSILPRMASQSSLAAFYGFSSLWFQTPSFSQKPVWKAQEPCGQAYGSSVVSLWYQFSGYFSCDYDPLRSIKSNLKKERFLLTDCWRWCNHCGEKGLVEGPMAMGPRPSCCLRMPWLACDVFVSQKAERTGQALHLKTCLHFLQPSSISQSSQTCNTATTS